MSATERYIPWEGWSDAVPIGENERDRLANEALASMEDDRPHTDIATGDTVIVVLRWKNGGIHLYDCIIRREATIVTLEEHHDED